MSQRNPLSAKERRILTDKTKPVGKTPLESLQVDMFMYGKKEIQTFKFLEHLSWALSMQNPKCLNQIKAENRNLLITGLGPTLKVDLV